MKTCIRQIKRKRAPAILLAFAHYLALRQGNNPADDSKAKSQAPAVVVRIALIVLVEYVGYFIRDLP